MAERHVTVSRQDQLLKQWQVFWERNRLQIIGALGIILLAFGSWGGSLYYQDYRETKAASLYAALPESGDLRRAGLETIARDFSTTGVGAYASFQLGQEDYQKQNYEQALTWYKPLMGLTGRQAMIAFMSRNNVATIYEAQGEWDKALAIYRESTTDAYNINKATSYYNMGRVSQNLGDREQARQWFQKAIEYGTGQTIAEQARERLIWLNIGSS